MAIEISQKVLKKILEKHNVAKEEVEQCFANRVAGYLKDTREQHDTNPPTLWFIAETDFGRKLKIIFMKYDDGTIRIKSAFEPNKEEIRIYGKYVK